jgi:hypothetical protein
LTQQFYTNPISSFGIFNNFFQIRFLVGQKLLQSDYLSAKYDPSCPVMPVMSAFFIWTNDIIKTGHYQIMAFLFLSFKTMWKIKQTNPSLLYSSTPFRKGRINQIPLPPLEKGE